MNDIDTMTAGEEMDRMVAERVMGWVVDDLLLGWVNLGSGSGASFNDWRPSTDIAHAWQVVERMRSLGWSSSLEDDRPVGGRWTCYLFKPGPPPQWSDATAETVQLAICRAALRAVGASR